MKILIADDDRIEVMVLSKRLKEKGYLVITAGEAVRAWVEASRRHPDGIILDIHMPGGSGVAVLRQLKTERRTKDIPVIIISSNTDPKTQALVKSLGANHFLGKPVDMNELFEQLARLVGTPPWKDKKSQESIGEDKTAA